MCFHIAFNPHELAFIVAFTIILFSNFLLSLFRHTKNQFKSNHRQTRARTQNAFSWVTEIWKKKISRTWSHAIESLMSWTQNHRQEHHFLSAKLEWKFFWFFLISLFSKKKSLQIKSCINSLLSTARWWTIGILGDSRAMVRRIWIHVYETLRWMDSTRSISMYLKTS